MQMVKHEKECSHSLCKHSIVEGCSCIDTANDKIKKIGLAVTLQALKAKKTQSPPVNDSKNVDYFPHRRLNRP